MNAIDTIIQYKQLLDQGIITPADFEAKKQETLMNGTDKGDKIELLRRYKGLLGWNAITPEEYEFKKRGILEQKGPSLNAIDSIAMYKQLLDEGIISQFDFDAKKTEALTAGTDRGEMVELLTRYKALLDAGVITAEEFEQKKNNLLVQKNKKKGKKGKKGVTIALIAVGVVAIAAVAALLLFGGKYKKLPGGVKFGDPWVTVVEKANKVEHAEVSSLDAWYKLMNGKIYGHHYDRVNFWMADDNTLRCTEVIFDDPSLDIQKLVKEVQKSYGKFDNFSDGHYYWYEKNMEICIYQIPAGDIVLEFDSGRK